MKRKSAKSPAKTRTGWSFWAKEKTGGTWGIARCHPWRKKLFPFLRRELQRFVTTARFEIRNQREVTGQRENGEQRHFAKRAELARGRRGGDRGRRGCVGHLRAFYRVYRLIIDVQITFLDGHHLIKRGIRRRQFFRCRRFLQIAEKRLTKNADSQHADAAHRIQCECAAARTLFRSQAENRRPEKSFADAVECRGGKDGEHSRIAGFGKREKSKRGERGGSREQTERRKLVDERPGAETQNQHDRRRINQHPRRIVPGGLHW